MESICVLRVGLRCDEHPINETDFPWQSFRMQNWLSLEEACIPIWAVKKCLTIAEFLYSTIR